MLRSGKIRIWHQIRKKKREWLTGNSLRNLSIGSVKTPTNTTASGMVKLSQLIGKTLQKSLNIVQWTENFQHCATDFMCDERVCCVFMFVCYLLEESDYRITGLL